MKREIKFRAWIPTGPGTGDMVQPYTLQEMIYSKSNTFPMAMLKRIDFMQYTGLHDKNGREIYEGDIIVTHPKMKYEIPKIGVVQYGDYRPMFQYKSGDGEEYSIWNNNVYRTYEVIGNIFENPELQEGKQ